MGLRFAALGVGLSVGTTACFVEVIGGGLGSGAAGGADVASSAVVGSGASSGTSATSGATSSAGDASSTAGTSSSSGGACSEVTIWDASATPFEADWDDSEAVEVGVRFRSDVTGSIVGVRFYKGALNTGTHVANLWTTNGQLLATATFASESASGWQRADFAEPAPIAAGTTYVASYHAPNGYYAVDPYYFANGDAYQPPLRALEDGVDGPNGVYNYGASAFPTETFNSNNYWVDAVFCAD